MRLTDYVRRDLDLDPKRFPARRLHAAISALKNELVSPTEAYERAFTPPEYRIAEVYREYQQRLLDASAVDFDDLLTLTVRLFQEHPEVLARWRGRFHHVLVDEFQDTNVAQWELVRMLTEEHRNVMVVGDTDQCLVAGTQVTMGDGSLRAIEHVHASDEVLSCYGSGDFRPARVLRTHRAHALDGIAITTASGRRIVSTAEHVHFAAERASFGTETVPFDARLNWLTASAVRPGAAMLDKTGRTDPVAWVERVRLDAAVYDLEIERTHNFVAEGLVTHNSIYKFRGADFRNLMRFEEVFPDATVFVLEQNYRSTQRILDAANAVIANNAARRPKHLWTEQVGGELITRYHAEDEHDEAALRRGRDHAAGRDRW